MSLQLRRAHSFGILMALPATLLAGLFFTLATDTGRLDPAISDDVAMAPYQQAADLLESGRDLEARRLLLSLDDQPLIVPRAFSDPLAGESPTNTLLRLARLLERRSLTAVRRHRPTEAASWAAHCDRLSDRLTTGPAAHAIRRLAARTTRRLQLSTAPIVARR